MTLPSKRRYVQRRRAERRDETRARILEAAIALHEELGPGRTTISAIAERAGVQRLTVYRHFTDEERLLEASSSRWISDHPPPDPALWVGLADPTAATHRALSHLFGYYRRTARRWTTGYRDRELVPALGPALARFEAYLGTVAEGLVQAWGEGAMPLEARALLHHALRFETWKSLSREGLSDTEMATLFADWIRAATASGPPGRSHAV